MTKYIYFIGVYHGIPWYTNKIKMENKADFFSEEKGESQFNLGKPFLIGVANQINNIRLSEREAFTNKGDFILMWLTELRCFYDMIESQLKLRWSKDDVELFEYQLINNKLIRVKKTVPEKRKFVEWFNEIEKMYERTWSMSRYDTGNSKILLYKKWQAVLLELSEVTREVYAEAEKRHLIMPNLKVDMKELAKAEWIDRAFTKEF